MSCVRAINPLDFSFCVNLQSNGPVLGLFQREPRRRLFSLRPFFWDGNPLKRLLPLSFLSSALFSFVFSSPFGGLPLHIYWHHHVTLLKTWRIYGLRAPPFSTVTKGMRMRNKPVVPWNKEEGYKLLTLLIINIICLLLVTNNTLLERITIQTHGDGVSILTEVPETNP